MIALESFILPKKLQQPAFNVLEDKLEGLFVLGKRMERMFEHTIQRGEHYEILAANLQIIEQNQTLGEIDFLVHEPSINLNYHIELVFKFYIYDPQFKDELSRWIGPNRKDSLLEKTTKLRQKQLPLLYRKTTKKVLAEMNISGDNFLQKVCYKASLFIPLSMAAHTFPLVNNECIKGYWIHFNDFTLSDYGKYSFYSPNKQFWPVDPSKNNTWLSYNEILTQLQQFIDRKRSPMLWIKTETQFLKVFVVWW